MIPSIKAALEHKIPPPVLGGLVGLGMWPLASLPPTVPLPTTPKLALVGALVAVGVAFDLLGLLAFRRSNTTINPRRPERASTLVTGGIYRVTRNPMYVGLLCLLLAWAIYQSGLWAFVGPAAFVAYVSYFQIAPEERVLRELFGEEYAAYSARVRRWL